MKILWLFYQTPNNQNIEMLKKLIRSEDIVVFIQNGVYVAKQNIDLICQNYVVMADAVARGIGDTKNMVDYEKLIDFVYNCEKVVTI